MFACCYRLPVDLDERLQKNLDVAASLVAQERARVDALEKRVATVEQKLPSPWVSTAASAATAVGMTVLSNGGAGAAAADLPRLIMGVFGK